MADFSSVQGVIQLLAPLVQNEVKLWRDLREEISPLQDDLRTISASLEIAEKKPTRKRGVAVNDWVNNARKLAFDIEDVFEHLELLNKHGKIHRALYFFEKRTLAEKVAPLGIRARSICKSIGPIAFLNPVSEQGQSSNTENCLLSISTSSSTGNESYLVGATASYGENFIPLLDLNDFNLGVSIVPVVGRRGVGKTTLARSVYNDDEVKDNFAIRAWITVSQHRSIEEILRHMLEQFQETSREHDQLLARNARTTPIDRGHSSEPRHYEDIRHMKEETLKTRLSSDWLHKRYLIVFDDVPQETMELAGYVKNLLHAHKNLGNKVLVTTCYEDVGRQWLDGFKHGVCRFEPLALETALDLFHHKAFPDQRCPQELEKLSSEIVEKCDGLPALIKELGEILCNKGADLHEWRKVSTDPWFYISESYQHSGSHTNLFYRYYDLHSKYKPCLLYFGLFPENYAIKRMRLIRLWVAEGFIRQESPGLTLEQIGEEYLEVLINEGLVKVENILTGRPKLLRVARKDLYDIIATEVKDSNFCQILSTRNLSVVGSRRLSISNFDVVDEVLGKKRMAGCESKVRTLLSLIKPSGDPTTKVLTGELLKDNCLLKILDLQNAPIQEVPKAIDELLNLTYLSLKNTRVKQLPSSIGKLQSLRTLNLKHTLILQLPDEIKSLVKLHHLLAYSYKNDPSYSKYIWRTVGVSVPKGALEGLKELQKLAFLDLSHVTHVRHHFASHHFPSHHFGSGTVVDELIHLKELRKLGMTGIKMENVKQVCAAIDQMQCLEAMSLCSVNNDTSMDLQYIRSPPQLKRLYLSGPLTQFPGWINQLESLVRIRLRWSRLVVDPLEILKALPNLEEIQLLDAYQGASLNFRNGVFQKLKVLNLLQLRNLRSLSISTGALPHLEEMTIGECESLQLPCGFENVIRLKKLVFFDMPTQFIDSLQAGAPFYYTIKHVTQVIFNVWFDIDGWQSYIL